MTKNFEPGQVVVCVDNDIGRLSLTVGRDYIVRHVTVSGMVQVMNDGGEVDGYHPTRFRAAKVVEPRAAPPQFACMLFSDDDHAVPVATGTTRNEVMTRGVSRALAIAASEGAAFVGRSSIRVIAQPRLSADDFKRLGELLDAFAAEKLGL